MNKTVVKVVKVALVRFNAWDSKGNKYTVKSRPARKKAYANGNVSNNVLIKVVRPIGGSAYVGL